MLILKCISNNQFLYKTLKCTPQIRTLSIDMSFEYIRSTNSGNRPPLIIMHGLLGSKRNWKSLGFAINKKTSLNVYLVDARNHGDSPHTQDHSYPLLSEDLKAFLIKHDISKAFLLGHSMGGRAMIYFALKNPKFVEKFVVADISPISSSPDLESIPNILRVVKSVQMPKGVSEVAARDAVNAQLAKSIEDNGMRAFILTNIKKVGDRYEWQFNIDTILNKFEKIVTFPDVTKWSYDGKVLFLAGEKSSYIKDADHENILKIFPNAEISKVSKAGHWLHFDNPHEFLSKITYFLK